MKSPIASLDSGADLGGGGADPRLPRGGVSHVLGVSAPPLLNVTVPQLLQDAADRFAERDAAVFPQFGVRWTYAEFREEVDRLAAGLLAVGLEKGDRIGIWAPNRPEWLAVQFASARIGAILVNINPAYRLAELEYGLNKTECKALLTAARFKSSDYLGMLQALAPELEKCEPGKLSSARLPHLRAVVRVGDEKTPGMLNYSEVLACGGPAHRARLDSLSAELDPDDAINIQFTSGTTGAPKRRGPHPQQHREQRPLRRPRHALFRSRPLVHSGSALPLLRNGPGRSRLRAVRRGDDFSRRGIRPAGNAFRHRRRKMHRRAWRADHVRRRTGPSRIFQT